MALQVGDRIGDYEVIDVLGVGGMGQVYKVQNIISKRIEAIKVLLPDLENNAHLSDRFMQEIEVQASLDHPHIAALHTAQRVDNQLIMVMEYVEGTTIDALLRNGPLPIDKAIEYTMQVLSALQYAHDRGIIHRDVKPANMMLTSSGTIKLLDFGIAKIADKRLTQTGHTVGSLYYMSPEQINDPLNLDGRADLYSVGIALYEMVTGRRPFQGDSDYSIMSAHLVASATPPIQIDPTLPEALNEIILMAIAKERDLRFQTAQAFERALAGIRSGIGASGIATAPMPSPVPLPTAPPPLPAAPPPTPTSGGRRGLYIALGSVATILVLAAAAWQGPRLFHSSAAAPAGQVTPATADQSVQPAPPVETVPQSQHQPQTTAVEEARPAVPVRPPRASPEPTRVAAPQGNRRVQTLVPTTPVQQPESTDRGPAPQQQQTDMREYRSQLMALGARARSVNTTLESLRAEQARSGMNLRGDVQNMKDRMELQLDEAERAIKTGDAEGAKKNLEAAEREIEHLEKFLGR